jgi:HSP20 family protein
MAQIRFNAPVVRTFNGLMEDLLNEFPSNTFFKDGSSYPAVNISETKDAYHLEMQVPGWEKNDFKVSAEGDLLTISAEKRSEAKNEDSKSIRKEFSYKSFKRSFTLDEKVDNARINARYENGILKLDLAKKEEVKVSPKEIAVQ